MRMQILHSVASIESEASGPSYSVPRLCGSLAELGHEVTLVSLGRPASIGNDAFRDIRCPRDAVWPKPLAKLGRSRAMKRELACANPEILHIHGLWTMPSVYPARTAARLRQPLVLSPRGMLGREALQFSALKKQAFWAIVQAAAVRRADCLHATAIEEYEAIRAFGLRQPVAIIPNGIDLPVPSPERSTVSSSPFVLSLGRIHPKKALDRLIRAWSLVAQDFPNWRLRIVGPSENGEAGALRKLAADLKLETVHIQGPLYGEEKRALLAEAELFALPSLNENFAMSVAESLVAGTPVISTKGAPWPGLVENDCGWWIEHGHEEMAVALKRAMSLPTETRRAMGLRGREWMRRDFGWPDVARRMDEVYRWLAAGGPVPETVRVT